jgi:hypothetical protein
LDPIEDTDSEKLQVRTYLKPRLEGTGHLKVQIVLTNTSPIQAIVSGFYNTMIVNCVNWDKACSIFPLSTFIHHRDYMLTEMTDCLTGLLAKYSLRGFDSRGYMWREENGSNHPLRNSRLVGDRFTWTIPFNTKNVTWSRTPDYILKHADFAIDVDRSHDFGSSEVGYNSGQTTKFV